MGEVGTGSWIDMYVGEILLRGFKRPRWFAVERPHQIRRRCRGPAPSLPLSVGGEPMHAPAMTATGCAPGSLVTYGLRSQARYQRSWAGSVSGGASMVREADGAKGDKPTTRSPGPERLGDRARQAMRLRNLSPRTEKAYLGWMLRYYEHHGRRNPLQLGAPEVTAFLNALATERRVAASTQNQALAALLFLYREVLGQDLPWLDDLVRARTPARLPVVLGRDEVRAVLSHMQGTSHLMGLLLYGAGLRLMECCRLRVKDIDFGRNQITVRRGKGNRDRATVLPAAARTALSEHLDRARHQHQRDLELGAGWVELPDALATKLPAAGREWRWQWVFPAMRHYRDAESGQLRRHHLHETALQRAVRQAVLASGISKRATCHTFRHNASRPTCWRRVATSARSSSYSVTRTCPRR